MDDSPKRRSQDIYITPVGLYCRAEHVQLLGNIKLPRVEATIRATPKNRNGTVAAAVASHLVNNCLIRVEWMRLRRRWDWEGKGKERIVLLLVRI